MKILCSLLFLLLSISPAFAFGKSKVTFGPTTLNWLGTANMGPFTVVSGITTYLVDKPDGTTPTYPSDLESLQYHHHTRVAIDSGGRVWVAYSGNLSVENASGMITEINSSANNWVTSTGPIVVVAPASTMNLTSPPGYRISYPRAFVKYGGLLYIVAAIDSKVAGGSASSDEQGLALVAAQCNGDGTIGTPFLVNSSGYTPNSGFPNYAYNNVLSPPLFTLANLYGVWGGSAPGETPSTWTGYATAGDGSVLVEPNTPAPLSTDLNAIFRIWRSTSGSNVNFNYQSMSVDGGTNWSSPIVTNIPNEASQSTSIKLANGHIALIGNVLDQASTTDARDPLYLAIFDGNTGIILHIYAIAQALPAPTYSTLTCGAFAKPCGAAYAGAWEVNGILWVSYSLNKEAIYVASIPSGSL